MAIFNYNVARSSSNSGPSFFAALLNRYKFVMTAKPVPAAGTHSFDNDVGI